MLRTESRRQQLAVSTGLRVSTAKKKEPTSSAYRLGKRKTICSLWYNYKRRSRLATDATQSFFSLSTLFFLSRLFRVNVVCSYILFFSFCFFNVCSVFLAWDGLESPHVTRASFQSLQNRELVYKQNMARPLYRWHDKRDDEKDPIMLRVHV